MYDGGTLLRAAPEHMRSASRLGTDVSSANRDMTRLLVVTGEIMKEYYVDVGEKTSPFLTFKKWWELKQVT